MGIKQKWRDESDVNLIQVFDWTIQVFDWIFGI